MTDTTKILAVGLMGLGLLTIAFSVKAKMDDSKKSEKNTEGGAIVKPQDGVCPDGYVRDPLSSLCFKKVANFATALNYW